MGGWKFDEMRGWMIAGSTRTKQDSNRYDTSDARSQSRHHATTSAELKLLLLRRTLRRFGRSNFVPGTTTAAALFVIQVPTALAADFTAATAAAETCTDAVEL